LTKFRIKKGTYRQRDVSGTVAESLIEKPKTGANGLYLTVKGEIFGFPGAKAKVLIDSEDDIELVDAKTPTKAPNQLSDAAIAAVSDIDWQNEQIEGDTAEETEVQAIKRINERFDILTELAAACGKGKLRGLAVIGAPGIGKSYGVEDELTNQNMNLLLNEKPLNFEVIKGHITSVVLFLKLYQFSGADKTIVFDDCDSIFFDPDALNMLKAALDTSKRRFISYNSDSNYLKAEGIPNRFEFKGSAIFITNYRPSQTRSEKLRAHLSALFDRVLSLDLTIDTPRDRFLRVKSVVQNSSMLDKYGFDGDEKAKLIDYIRQNIHRLESGVTLRTVLNLADLMKVNPSKWEYYARNTLLKK